MGSVARNDFDKLAAGLEHRIAAATQASADEAIGWARASMSEAKHGKQWPALPNRSSAPGESPAIQSQTLADSLHAYPTSATDRRIATAVPYAIELEFGTHGKAARPFLSPALHAVAAAHWARLSKALRGR